MTIQEKIENLTPEQRAKLQTVKTEQELDAFLAEAKLETTTEERATLSQHLKAKNGELTDDELEAAAGGKNFDKCPKGHYEATGFANILGNSWDCFPERCEYSSTEDSSFGYWITCRYFNRRVTHGFLSTI